MYKEVLIGLLGILLLTTTIQSRAYYEEESSEDSSDDSSSDSDDDDVVYDLLRSLHNPKARNHKLRFEHHQRQSADYLQQFRDEMLQAHNKYRAQHCVEPLTLDDELNDEAQKYAEYLLSINRLEHAKLSGVGENLYGGSTAPIPMSVENLGNAASDMWYNEVDLYNYDQPGFSLKTGHFTQLVWKSSKNLGAGVAYSSDHTKLYVVARYSPRGNFGDQYDDNVLKKNC